MGFPECKYKRRWFFSEKVSDGWEDRGQTGRFDYLARSWINEHFHSYCGQVLYIGREAGDVFMFCPRCLVKVEDN